MPASRTAKTITATRIRLGLLRVKMIIDPQRMVDDISYAAEVLSQCRQSGVRELARLADEFESDASESSLSSSRYPDDAVADSSLPPASTYATVVPSTHAHSGVSEVPRDPNDPHHSRTQRYLRGAR